MIRITMAKRALAILGMAALGAQAGHLIAYQLHFGAGAFRIQSSGAHAYFPTLLKTTFGAAALAVIAGLLLVGAASLLARGQGRRTPAGGSFIGILAVLFTVQLGLFIVQEVGESVAAGMQPASAESLLIWGMVGQLPVALAGACALRWLWTRVEAAAYELSAVAAVTLPAARLAPVAVVPVRESESALLGSHAARSRFVKRGPPISS